tara:strand:+ start:4295 stop:4771 length:477 start_codon:yes stop_codon:yes gene_type:complete
MEWNDNQILSMLKRYNECKKRKDCHYNASLYFDTLDKFTTIPQIILTSILSTSSLTQLTDDDESIVLAYVTAICSIILAIITSINKFFELQKYKESHKKTSFSYGKLERMIDLEMNRTNKNSFDTIYETITSDYNNIRESSHLIPNYFPENTMYRTEI